MSDAVAYRRADGSCPFEERFNGLSDVVAAARIGTAVGKLERGLRSDVRSVGEGVHEARIDHGPGYRIYFGIDGRELIILLLCRDKRTQGDDISISKQLWIEYRLRKRSGRLG
jgi:putative addiction module killer protein